MTDRQVSGRARPLVGTLPGNVVVQIRDEPDDFLKVDFNVSDAVPIVLIVDPLPSHDSANRFLHREHYQPKDMYDESMAELNHQCFSPKDKQ